MYFSTFCLLFRFCITDLQKSCQVRKCKKRLTGSRCSNSQTHSKDSLISRESQHDRPMKSLPVTKFRKTDNQFTNSIFSEIKAGNILDKAEWLARNPNVVSKRLQKTYEACLLCLRPTRNIVHLKNKMQNSSDQLFLGKLDYNANPNICDLLTIDENIQLQNHHCELIKVSYLFKRTICDVRFLIIELLGYCKAYNQKCNKTRQEIIALKIITLITQKFNDDLIKYEDDFHRVYSSFRRDI